MVRDDGANSPLPNAHQPKDAAPTTTAHWSGTDVTGPSHNFTPAPPPTVTVAPTSGSGRISVDTDVLGRLANALAPLVDELGDAATKLDGLQLAPGTFAEAANMAASVSGQTIGTGGSVGAGGGLAASYRDNMRQMSVGIQQFVEGLRSIASKYSDVEDLNGKAAGDVSNALSALTANIPQPPTTSTAS